MHRGQMRRLSGGIRPSVTAPKSPADRVTRSIGGPCDLRASLLQGWCEQQHSALSSWRRRLRLSLLRRQLLPSPRGKACSSPMAARSGVVTKQGREDDARGCPHRSQRIGFCLRAYFDQSPRIPTSDAGLGWQHARRRRGAVADESTRERIAHTNATHSQTTQAASTPSRRSARRSKLWKKRNY